MRDIPVCSNRETDNGRLICERSIPIRRCGRETAASKSERRRATLGVLLLATVLPCLAGQADELSEKGRAVFKKYQHAVVTVELVLKNKFSMAGRGGEANESRQDVTGTVVDPSGLTVLSLSATDPAQMLQTMFSSSDEDSKFKMETELSDIKILLDDGTELAAEVVLRDRDLDLAFIRPKTKVGAPLVSLDLTNSGKAEILDQVISLTRLGNAAGRAYAASVGRIAAIVQRPRLYYVPDASMTTTTLGAPAFTLEGKPLGIFVMRSIKGRSNASVGFFNSQADNIVSIIIPTRDILKAVKQVPPEEGNKSQAPSSGEGTGSKSQ